MKKMLSNWWGDRFLRYLTLSLFLLGVFLLLQTSSTPVSSVQPDMEFFFLPTCPHCHEQMEFHDEVLSERFPDLNIRSYDVSTSQGQSMYQQRLSSLGESVAQITVPVTIINGTVIRGFDSAQTTGEQIITLLDGGVVDEVFTPCNTEGDCNQDLTASILGFEVSVNPSQFSLPMLAIVLGGLDGFNPCAMWVLVYLISLVMVLKNKRRAWLLVGVFLAASGILYFLFMTAWLQVFLFVGLLRTVQVAVGLFALGVGIANLKSWYVSKGKVTCEVGDLHTRAKTSKKVSQLVNSPLTWGAFGGIIALAFAVNSIEFMCSFGIPAVFTEVLAVAPIAAGQRYLLIALYVLMYMIDDLIIFSLAVFAVQSDVGQKYAGLCKLLAGLIMVFLGVALAFFPQLLMGFA